MTRLSPLETKVLDALADELRVELPDLPGQIAESLVGVRRNTGSGFFTEVIVDRSRPPTGNALTGRFGTIHGDVPGLIEPMAFQVEIAGGRLMGLHGSTYGERTDLVDFLVAPISGLFRINDQGESVALKPPVSMIDSPLRALQRSDEPAPAGLAQPSVWDGGSPHIARSHQLIEAGRTDPSPAARAVLELLFGKRTDGAPDAPAPTSEEQTSLVIGAVVALAVIGLFAVLFFDVPFFFALIMFVYLVGALTRPKGQAALRKMIDLYKTIRPTDGR